MGNNVCCKREKISYAKTRNSVIQNNASTIEHLSDTDDLEEPIVTYPVSSNLQLKCNYINDETPCHGIVTKYGYCQEHQEYFKSLVEKLRATRENAMC
jgi:hypothetical protein